HDFYVEIKEIRMISDAESLKERRLNTLTDSMNSVDCTYFMLCIESIEFKTGKQPSGKKIIKYFDNLIKAYDPDIYRKMLEKDGFSMMPKLKYDDDDVLIKIRLTP